MTKFVSIYANGDEGPVVTVTEAFAEGIGAEVLEFPALDSRSRPMGPRSREDAAAQKEAAEAAVKATETAEPAPADAAGATAATTGRRGSNSSPSGDAGSSN